MFMVYKTRNVYRFPGVIRAALHLSALGLKDQLNS